MGDRRGARSSTRYVGADPARAGTSADAKARVYDEAARTSHARAANYRKGAAGERMTASRLASLPSTFVVFHDLHVPGSKANVDHLVVGRNGVFLIDSKAYAGPLTIGSGTLWQGRYSLREKFEGARSAADAVSAHLGVPVTAVLCFTEASLPAPSFGLDDVAVVGLDELCPYIESCRAQHTDEMVAWLAHLADELTEPVAPTPEFRRTAAPRQPSDRQRAAAVRPREPLASTRRGCVTVVVAAAVGLALMAVIGAAFGASKHAIDAVVPTTTPKLAPAVPYSFVCPGPGAGYTLSFGWPGGPSGVRTYEIAVVWAGSEVYRHRWSIEAQPPPPIPALAPGQQFLVTTWMNKFGVVTTGQQTVTAPPAPC